MLCVWLFLHLTMLFWSFLGSRWPRESCCNIHAYYQEEVSSFERWKVDHPFHIFTRTVTRDRIEVNVCLHEIAMCSGIWSLDEASGEVGERRKNHWKTWTAIKADSRSSWPCAQRRTAIRRYGSCTGNGAHIRETIIANHSQLRLPLRGDPR